MSALHRPSNSVVIGGAPRKYRTQDHAADFCDFELRLADSSSSLAAQPLKFGRLEDLFVVKLVSGEKKLVARATLCKMLKTTAFSKLPIVDLTARASRAQFISASQIGRRVHFNNHPDCNGTEQCVLYSSPDYEPSLAFV